MRAGMYGRMRLEENMFSVVWVRGRSVPLARFVGAGHSRPRVGWGGASPHLSTGQVGFGSSINRISNGVAKTYLAIVEGHPGPAEGAIDEPLWEDRALANSSVRLKRMA